MNDGSQTGSSYLPAYRRAGKTLECGYLTGRVIEVRSLQAHLLYSAFEFPLEGSHPAFADLLAEQVLWQARAACLAEALAQAGYAQAGPRFPDSPSQPDLTLLLRL